MNYLSNVKVTAVALVDRGANRRKLIYKNAKEKDKMKPIDIAKYPFLQGISKGELQAETLLKALADEDRAVVSEAMTLISESLDKLGGLMGYPTPKFANEKAKNQTELTKTFDDVKGMVGQLFTALKNLCLLLGIEEGYGYCYPKGNEKPYEKPYEKPAEQVAVEVAAKEKAEAEKAELKKQLDELQTKCAILDDMGKLQEHLASLKKKASDADEEMAVAELSKMSNEQVDKLISDNVAEAVKKALAG